MTVSRSHDPISVADLVRNDPAALARMNAAYPSVLYHMQEILPSHAIPDDYLAGFRVPELQAALAETFSPACVEERAARNLSFPLVDARDRPARPVPDDALRLVHDGNRGWQVIATRPIAAGDAIGYYWGDFSYCQGLAEERPGGPWESIRRYLDRVIDSHPGAERLSPSDRRDLKLQIQDTMAEHCPYGFLITLPRPGSPPVRLLVDALKRGSIARFMNHSETTNVERLFCRDVRDGTWIVRVSFFAAVDIAEGEELVYDYRHGEAEMPVDHGRMRDVHETIMRAIESAGS